MLKKLLMSAVVICGLTGAVETVHAGPAFKVSQISPAAAQVPPGMEVCWSALPEVTAVVEYRRASVAWWGPVPLDNRPYCKVITTVKGTVNGTYYQKTDSEEFVFEDGANRGSRLKVSTSANISLVPGESAEMDIIIHCEKRRGVLSPAYHRKAFFYCDAGTRGNDGTGRSLRDRRG